MNFMLMEQIIRHVLANLGVVPSDTVDLSFNLELRTDQFLLPEKLTFAGTDGESDVVNHIWGCQITSQQKSMKILLGDCTQDSRIPEFCLITQLEGAPPYGLYLVFNDLVDGCLPDPLIAVSTNKNWMVCETYLQATFLAAMEQVRSLGFGWTKCTNYREQFELLNSFIKYHSAFYGGV